MFASLVSGEEYSPEIEMFHENIRMETRATVRASFVIAPEEAGLVCSVPAPRLPSFASATQMHLTQCQL